MSPSHKRVRVPDFKQMKARGEKIVMLTAYDASMARLLDSAGIDALLVGDSLGMVIMGCETTLPVTLAAMLHHVRAVSRGVRRALVIADMPFLTFQVSVAEAVRNAGRLIQAGAAAVKIEGGKPVAETAARLVEVGIPVMGHLGLVPQSVHKLGGFRFRADPAEAAEQLLEEAKALERAGVFAVVLESVPAEAARRVTAELSIPTIGIGAGPGCDGQVLVSYDVFGLYPGPAPPFVRQYANLGELMVEAARRYAQDVKEGRFPSEQPREAASPGGSAES